MGNADAGPAPDPDTGLCKLLRESLDLEKGSTGAMLQELLQAARLSMSMEVSFISQFAEGRRYFRYVDEEGKRQVLKVGDSDPLESSCCQRVVDGRLPQLIPDTRELSPEEVPGCYELNVGAHASVPITLEDGTVYGTLCTFSFRADHTLNERDAALMHVFAKIASELIDTDLRAKQDYEIRRKRIANLLENDLLTAVWQPIMEIASRRIIGVESLARFPAEPHPGPVEWFNEANEAGFAEALELKAIKNGLAVIDDLPDDVYVSCNVSARAFLEGRIIELLENKPLDRIVLEITEHDIIEDYAALHNALTPLRRKGLRLAVDDAGAGYASFRHVLRLNPETIKLDMSLTRDIDSDISRRSLSASLQRFADEIDSTLVAEGVETQEELDTLEALGVPSVQGFYLCRPKPLEELKGILERGVLEAK